MRKCLWMGQRRYLEWEKSVHDNMQNLIYALQIVPIGLLIWFGRLWRFHGSLFASQKKTSRNWILLHNTICSLIYKSRLSGICLNSCNQNAMKWKFTFCYYKSHLLRLWMWVRFVSFAQMRCYVSYTISNIRSSNRRDGNMDSNSENSLISFNFAHHRCHLSA